MELLQAQGRVQVLAPAQELEQVLVQVQVQVQVREQEQEPAREMVPVWAPVPEPRFLLLPLAPKKPSGSRFSRRPLPPVH